jgi:hypothetical protein
VLEAGILYSRVREAKRPKLQAFKKMARSRSKSPAPAGTLTPLFISRMIAGVREILKKKRP